MFTAGLCCPQVAKGSHYFLKITDVSLFKQEKGLTGSTQRNHESYEVHSGQPCNRGLPELPDGGVTCRSVQAGRWGGAGSWPAEPTGTTETPAAGWRIRDSLLSSCVSSSEPAGGSCGGGQRGRDCNETCPWTRSIDNKHHKDRKRGSASSCCSCLFSFTEYKETLWSWNNEGLTETTILYLIIVFKGTSSSSIGRMSGFHLLIRSTLKIRQKQSEDPYLSLKTRHLV